MANITHESFSDESTPFPEPSLKTPKRFEFACTAMSHCGDYRDFVVKTLNPFYEKYADLAALFDYTYVSFTEVLGFYDQRGISLHNQLEVRDDKVLSCANSLLTDEDYVRLSLCFVESYQTTDCVYNTLGTGLANDILFCAEDEVFALLA